MDVASLELIQRADIFITWHKAFADMAGYWPAIPDNLDASPEEQAFAQKFCAMPRAVVGSPTDATIWSKQAVLDPDALGPAIERLEREFGVVITYGGVRAAQALLREDLVDELHLFVSTESIGAGHSLFARTMIC